MYKYFFQVGYCCINKKKFDNKCNNKCFGKNQMYIKLYNDDDV